jgi:hypothetical protein
MKAYNYSRNTKEYMGEVPCQADPLDGGFLIPGHATDIKPEQPKEGHVMIFKDDGWVEVIDRRGPVYDKTTKDVEIWRDVGELPPYLTYLTPQQGDKWDEENEEWVEDEKHLIKVGTDRKKQLEYEKSYLFKRGISYPSLWKQLDMLYWDMKNGTDNWVKSRDAVKEQFPKEE